MALFARVTFGTYLVFAAFYLLVYWKTAGSYYRIVRSGSVSETKNGVIAAG